MPRKPETIPRGVKVLIAKKESLFKTVQTMYDLTLVKETSSTAAGAKAFLAKFKNIDYLKQAYVETLDELNDAQMEEDEKFVPDFNSLEAFLDLCGVVSVFAEKIQAALSSQGSSSSSQQPTPPPVQEAQSKVKLPTLDLPSFDGEDLYQWEIFYHSFESLINKNSSLNDDQRVNYLMSKLSGKALTVCAGIPAIGSNYQQIYTALKDRFSDKRLLASFYLDQLLNFKQIKSESVEQLNLFIDKFCAASKGLENLKLEDKADFIIGYIGANKLDYETARLYQLSIKNEIPSLVSLSSFVQEHVRSLKHIQPCSSLSSKKPGNSAKPKETHSFMLKNESQIQGSDKKCLCCKQGSHALFACEKFKHMDPSARHEVVKTMRICFNCLNSNHRVVDCKFKTSCIKCGKRHNTLLHFNNGNVSSHSEQVSQPTVSMFAGHVEKANNNTTVLLSTVQVNIFDKFGNVHPTRLLLDNGSQAQFLTQKVAQRLGLELSRVPASVKGICGTTSAVKGITSFTFSSHLDPSVKFTSEAYVVNQILDKSPVCTLDSKYLTHLDGLQLADSNYHQPGEIEGILGANIFVQVLEYGKVSGLAEAPIAFKTSLGYVVSGSAPIQNITHSSENQFCGLIQEPIVEDLLHKFFELEEVPSPVYLNQDDKKCEQLFVDGLFRQEDGRYSVKLPFSEHPNALGDSFSAAHRRFLSLERKLESSKNLKIEYCAVIKEYMELGYMSLVEEECSMSGYYIPHHAVVRPDKETTKVRVVMDASCKTSSGVSLNDILYCGAKLYTDLFNLLLQFRMYEIAMTADITKCFYQVLLNEEHRIYQKILWRFSPEEPLQTYQINRVLFGVKSSPFLVQRVLRQLAKDEEKTHPLGSHMLQSNFYMDDYVCSIQSLAEAKEAQTQLVDLCKLGGFSLVKWCSNNKQLMKSIDPELLTKKQVEFSDSLKILGLIWKSNADYFTFSVNTTSKECTKRTILSAISTIFDPLGFLQPIILTCKLMISELWKAKLDWDQQPSVSICNQWSQFKEELELISQLQIPRCLNICSLSSIVLVGFCDASEKAYGAVLYCRSESNTGVNINIVCSKTKVAPLKTESVPRLELCAALLLSNLIKSVLTVYPVSSDQLFCFSDSTVALDWVHSSPHRWNQFVANRVSKIQQNVESNRFFHVAGKENPSDCSSRGLSPRELVNHPIWWSGPTWLKQPINTWSLSKHQVSDSNMFLEEKKSTISCATSLPTPDILLELSSKFSSWTKLLNCVVYILRFCGLLPRKQFIETTDLNCAEITLIKAVQKHHFLEDLQALGKNETTTKQTRKLKPFLDEGVIRVGGRISNSNLGYEQCHPILLPKNNHVVKLIIYFHHRINLHTGPHLLLAILRRKFWILSAAKDVTSTPLNRLQRYELLDQLVQSYWKRWSQEFLTDLQTREKWNQPSNPVAVGQVVIMMQENTPVLTWPLGVIQEVYPGKDGVVRAALVKTKSGLFKRPVVKLCPLPSQ